MGLNNNTVRVFQVTTLGLMLRERYLNFIQKLNNNDLIDWIEIKDELNGHYAEYLLPTGIMANNLDTLLTRGEQTAVGTYTFNFADMEDDHIQELEEAGYLQFIDPIE